MVEDLFHIEMAAVHDEAIRAMAKYGNFRSMHEGYGVLAEEVAELFEAVRLRQDNPTRGRCIRSEAIQVAAVALRIAAQALECSR
jgi:hypothetical protein